MSWLDWTCCTRAFPSDTLKLRNWCPLGICATVISLRQLSWPLHLTDLLCSFWQRHLGKAPQFISVYPPLTSLTKRVGPLKPLLSRMGAQWKSDESYIPWIPLGRGAGDKEIKYKHVLLSMKLLEASKCKEFRWQIIIWLVHWWIWDLNCNYPWTN